MENIIILDSEGKYKCIGLTSYKDVFLNVCLLSRFGAKKISIINIENWTMFELR